MSAVAACASVASESFAEPAAKVQASKKDGAAEQGANREAANPDRTGLVWTGTVGDLPITACFLDRETSDGAYYYHAHLKPLRLVQIDKGAPAVLTEIEGFNTNTGASWTIASKGDARLSGTWRMGERELPITLSAVPVNLPEFGSDCESAEFVEPLIVGGSVSEKQALFEGVNFTKLDYTPPAHLDIDSYLVGSFALNAGRPGDEAINRTLAKALPDGTVTHHMGQCVGMSIGTGQLGYFNETLSPVLISDEWLGIDRTGSTYCGGAHPSHFLSLEAYNRSSGQQVDPSRWFKPGTLIFYEFESDLEGETTRPIAGLTERLMNAVLAHWPDQEGGPGCAEFAREGTGWDLGLEREGVAFVRQFPHVIFSCTAVITVPWSQLEPFLSDEGVSVRESLR
ncbi:MAG: hypothetical protein AAGK02_04830 [Pseudomonadota bacterium]